jgi:hypothetical protein
MPEPPAIPISDAKPQNPKTYAISDAGISKAPPAKAKWRFFPRLRCTGRPVCSRMRISIGFAYLSKYQ